MAAIKREKKREILDKVISSLKLKDAGRKQEKDSLCCSSPGDVMYPSLYLDVKQAPGLENYEVEDKVTMIIEGVVTNHHSDESLKRKRENFELSIKKIGVKPKEDKE